MKTGGIIVLMFYAISAQALVNWPSASAPCNGTLLDCANNSPEGETIVINSDTPDAGNVFISNPVSLVAGAGYTPTFTGLVTVVANAASSHTLFMRGLHFDTGKLYVIHTSGPRMNLRISDNVINGGTHVNPLNVITQASSGMDISIRYNRVNVNNSGTTTVEHGAIKVWGNGGPVTAELVGNTVFADGSDSIGITLQNSDFGDMDLDVVGNEFHGGVQAGLLILGETGGGEIDANVFSNVFLDTSDFWNFSGLHVRNEDPLGPINVDIVNNTMYDTRWGMELVQQGGASVDAFVYNNLVAECGRGFDFIGGVTVSNDNNLYWNNPLNSNFTPGPDAINADPQVIAHFNARLRAGSPARDSGDGFALFAVAGVDLVDADGGNRFKKGTAAGGADDLDIGAYEAGDAWLQHRHTGSGTHTSPMRSEWLAGQAALDDLHLTANYNPPGSPGVYNNADEGIYYANGLWRVFNEQTTINIATGAAFNLFKFGSSANTFEHTVSSSGNNSTTLSATGLDGDSSRILSVTQHWTNIYNTHPPAVFYFSGAWAIINADLANLPINANFNVSHQPASKSAWVHRAQSGNIGFNDTYIDHPLINGVACAQLQVTQSANGGVFNDHPIGVWFSSVEQKWAIYNQDLAVMPANAEFHVIASPEQIADCQDLIFANDFY